MQKSLAELAALAQEERSALFSHIDQPLLITDGAEFLFVAQPLNLFEQTMNRLRDLEATERKQRGIRAKSGVRFLRSRPHLVLVRS